ncbi:MAG: hypothetical protein GY714_15905 [Desulfobacterales bacterium]|nr:hypothetical protein [Desulfobacterales bacterium]
MNNELDFFSVLKKLYRNKFKFLIILIIGILLISTYLRLRPKKYLLFQIVKIPKIIIKLTNDDYIVRIKKKLFEKYTPDKVVLKSINNDNLKIGLKINIKDKKSAMLDLISIYEVFHKRYKLIIDETNKKYDRKLQKLIKYKNIKEEYIDFASKMISKRETEIEENLFIKFLISQKKNTEFELDEIDAEIMELKKNINECKNITLVEEPFLHKNAIGIEIKSIILILIFLVIVAFFATIFWESKIIEIEILVDK